VRRDVNIAAGFKPKWIRLAFRPDSKQARVLAMLRRPEGAKMLLSSARSSNRELLWQDAVPSLHAAKWDFRRGEDDVQIGFDVSVGLLFLRGGGSVSR
jgi:hypothetical protein